MIYLFLFILEVFILVVLEKRQWGSWITPLNVLALPYLIAVLTIILYREFVPGIVEFYYPSLLIWMFGLLLFEFPSAIYAKCLQTEFKQKTFSISVARKDDSYKLLRNIAYVCIGISLLKISSLSANLDAFGTDDFSEQYQSAGIFNHLSVLLGCIFSFAIYKFDSKHKSALVIIIGALFGMYAVGTKSWIIAPVLMGYYARLLTGKTTLSVRTTIFPVLIVIGIFFFSYYLTLILITEKEMSDEFLMYIINHFVNYFCSGALTLGLDCNLGFSEPQMTEALFGPIYNIYNAIMRYDYVQVINPVFLDMGSLGTSNVRTFFGTIIAYSKDPILFICMSLIFSSYIYYIYFISRKSQSLFLLLANTANLVFLTFGFFEFYWLNLSCYEIPFICLFMHYFLYIKNKNYAVETSL